MSVDWIKDLGVPSFGKNATDGIQCGLVFLGALVVSLILTPMFRGLMRKLGMIDQPSERRINKTPVPRGGGLSIFIAFHLVLAVFACLMGVISESFSVRWQVAFFIGSTMLVTLGFIDDKRGMKPLVKLTGQILIASFLFFSGIHVGGILFTFPLWLDYAVTVFWIVGAINAFNLIDGLDGLASGLAMIASFGLAGALFFTGRLDDMIPYFALGGACLGFLRYNFHPATVFLGDTGSMFLGLCVATLPLVSGSRLELLPSLIVPLLAMGIPIFDTLLAIWRRAIRALLFKATGELSPGQQTRVMEPDKDHLHHRVLRLTMNQKTAAWMFYGVSTALVAVGLFGTLSKKGAPGVFLIAFIFAVVVIVKHLARVELWDTGRLLSGRHVMIRTGLITPLYVILDLLFLVLMWMLTCWVLYSTVPLDLFISHMPLHVGAIFIFLVLMRMYQRVWRRAHFSDFSLLLVAVAFGEAFASGLIVVLFKAQGHSLQFGLVFAAFALFPLLGSRLVVESLKGAMQALKRLALLQNEKVTKLLVYGAGIRFRNYMREQTAYFADADRVIIGIIDDDLQFQGRVIYGYKVLGGLNDIPEICKKNKVDRIVITCVLPAALQETLLRIAAQHNFKLSVWVNEERELANP